MVLIDKVLGTSGVELSVTISAGKVSVTESYTAEAGADTLLVSLEGKYPSLAPYIAMIKASIDAELSQS